MTPRPLTIPPTVSGVRAQRGVSLLVAQYIRELAAAGEGDRHRREGEAAAEPAAA